MRLDYLINFVYFLVSFNLSDRKDESNHLLIPLTTKSNDIILRRK